MEVREYLVLKYDGKTERFPVLDGDVAQARLRAALVQRPNDSVVVVTEDAYIRVRPEPPIDGRPTVGYASNAGDDPSSRATCGARSGRARSSASV